MGRHSGDEASGRGCFTFFLIMMAFLVYFDDVHDKFFSDPVAVKIVKTKNGPAHDYSLLRTQIHQNSDEAILTQFKAGKLRGAIDNAYGRYLLHLVAEIDRSELIEELFKVDRNINQKDRDGNTPLHIALKGESASAAATLYKLGADLLATNVHKQTILHFACQYNNITIALAAIKNGANVKAMQTGNWAPIHYACSAGNIAMVVLLAENGADLSVPVGYGWTPGDIVFGKHPNIASFLHSRKALFSKGYLMKNYNLVNGWPLFSNEQAKNLPRSNPVFNAVLEDSPTALAELLAQGIDIDISNDAKTPILGLAILNSRFQAAEYLMHKVKDLDASDANGKNALIHAIESGNKHFTHQLIAKAGNVLHLDNSGLTALHYAIANCDNDIAAELINKGADIFARDYFMRGMMHTATANNNEVMFASLIANGCDVNQEDISGNTPLHLAVLQNNLGLVNSLLSNGADFAIKNNKQQTPLMLATTGPIRLLLTNRFEIEGVNPADRSIPAEVQILPGTGNQPEMYEKY